MTLVLAPLTPQLAPFVAALGYYDGRLPPGRERVLPAGMTDLMINVVEDEFRTYDEADRACRVRGAILRGPTGRSTVIDTAEQCGVISVSFKLGGARAVLPVPSSAATDQVVELDRIWGRAGTVLRERVLEADTVQEKLRTVETALVEQLVAQTGRDPAIDAAAAGLERGLPVAEVAGRLGWLPNRLARVFRDRVGLTPKHFARVRRLQRVLATVTRGGTEDWAEIAVKHGYYDQAHLINDFRDLAGITPTAYRPRSPGERNHVPL